MKEVLNHFPHSTVVFPNKYLSFVCVLPRYDALLNWKILSLSFSSRSSLVHNKATNTYVWQPQATPSPSTKITRRSNNSQQILIKMSFLNREKLPAKIGPLIKSN